MDAGFSLQRLAQALQRLPAARRYWVAYSGGLDSHALLHATVALRARRALPDVVAAHINHGLQPEADAWERHCRQICRELRVPCRVIRVHAGPRIGESPESAARRARYQGLRSLVGEQEMLLTAHHRDDQAETVLLQIVRGAGPAGLAGMPVCSAFGQGWLARPLLDVSRVTLEQYGGDQGLRWISDASNADTHYDRNFVRHQVLPTLTARWPAVKRTLSRVAANQQDASCLLQELAAADYAVIVGPTPDTLSRTALVALSAERRRNVVRYWLNTLGLPMASRAHLGAVLSQMMDGNSDTSACVRWPGAEIRRYRDTLYAMPPRCAVVGLQAPIAWDLMTPLELMHGQLRATVVRGAGLGMRSIRGRCVQVQWRRGGERCRPTGYRHTRKLKKLLQERGVPPWERDRLPLIYVDGDLAAVGPLWVCEPFAAREDEAGWLLSWQPVPAQKTIP